MRIYISGKITGLSPKEASDHFTWAEKYLQEKGHSTINPFRTNKTLPADMTHSEYMKICRVELDLCEAIFMLDNWRDSMGAKMELEWALLDGKEVMFEGVD